MSTLLVVTLASTPEDLLIQNLSSEDLLAAHESATVVFVVKDTVADPKAALLSAITESLVAEIVEDEGGADHTATEWTALLRDEATGWREALESVSPDALRHHGLTRLTPAQLTRVAVFVDMPATAYQRTDLMD